MPKQSKPDEVPEFKPSPKVFAIQKESEKWGEMLKVDMVGALNDYISRNGIQKLMLIGEALQEGKISAIAEQISSRRDVEIYHDRGSFFVGQRRHFHSVCRYSWRHTA